MNTEAIDDVQVQIDDASERSGGAMPRWQFGAYEVLGKLARGGMATIFLGLREGDAGFQRLVALKVLHPHLAEEEEFVRMFLDESRLAAAVHHPNVVATFDLGYQDASHWLAMEYIEGCSFSQLLKRNHATRPVQLVVPIVVDALLGLHAAHILSGLDGRPLGLVHRDVSPHNILVGVDGVSRLTDFGIARAEGRLSSTRPGIRKGKFAYMAPEQLLEGTDFDQRADVFSAGVVLWSALTGEPLFQADVEATTIHNLMHKVVEPPSHVGLRPPAAYDAVALRALERDPKMRFGSALEMAEALRAIAVERHEFGFPHEVGAWVQNTFERELELRRRAVRAALAGTRAAALASGTDPLAAVPTLTVTPSSSHVARFPSIAPEPLGALFREARSTGAPPPHRRAWRHVAFAGAALLLGTGFLAWAAIGGSSPRWLGSRHWFATEARSFAPGPPPVRTEPVRPSDLAPLGAAAVGPTAPSAFDAPQPSSAVDEKPRMPRVGIGRGGYRRGFARAVRQGLRGGVRADVQRAPAPSTDSVGLPPLGGAVGHDRPPAPFLERNPYLRPE